MATAAHTGRAFWTFQLLTSPETITDITPPLLRGNSCTAITRRSFSKSGAWPAHPSTYPWVSVLQMPSLSLQMVQPLSPGSATTTSKGHLPLRVSRATKCADGGRSEWSGLKHSSLKASQGHLDYFSGSVTCTHCVGLRAGTGAARLHLIHLH